MNVTFVRHGTAEPHAARDRERALTLVGRAEARAQGRALRAAIGVPDLILSSPWVRAVQTAELLAAALGYVGVISLHRGFRPDGSPAAAAEVVASLPSPPIAQNVVIVAHEPILSATCGLLLGDAVEGLGRAEALSLSWEPPALATARLTFRAIPPPL